MPSSTSNSERDPALVAEFERRWWRRGRLLLPLLGAWLGLLWVTHGWEFVACDRSLARPLAGDLPVRPMILGALAGGVAALAWWVCLRLQARLPGRAWTFSAPFFLGCLLVAGAEVAVRQATIQSPFWLGVRARLRAGYADYFTRELAYWRLDVLNRAPRPRALVVAGSSQVLHGIDCEQLAAGTGRPVKRRALAGMDPMKLCSAQDWLDAERGDTLILYLSEFDFSGEDRLVMDWMRPLASPRGAADVLRALPASEIHAQWRSLTDLWCSAISELWRLRDYTSHMLFHPLGPIEPVESGDTSPLREQERLYKEGTARPEINHARLRALERAVARLQARGVSVVIFEGQVNPSMRNANGERLRAQTREQLASLAARHPIVFVPVSEQKVSIDPSDWLDGTHMNADGRRKFTDFVARALRDQEAGAR